MKISEAHIDYFEAYLSGKLSDIELTEFEARLVYDYEFSDEFKAYQQLEKGIKSHYRDELKDKLQNVDKQLDGNNSIRSKRIKMIAWTSSIAAAFVIGIFLMQNFSTSENTELAHEYWPHEEGLPVKMSNKGKYDEAMNAFKLEDWKLAEQLLLEMDSDTAYYFLGIIYFELDEIDNSSTYFQKTPEKSTYFEEAQFRLALVYLLIDEHKAKLLLQKIAESKSSFSSSASAILSKF